MAAAAPSPLASSLEETNGFKLSRLLIDGGTTVLRTIFDGYHPPAFLCAGLIANYSTLQLLLKRRVLHAAQWDKLFPPSGATPDSKKFDITLLFLLLTNICGLSPPATGWHRKPTPSDQSLEANLVRVKFFRNMFYGDMCSTGIDTPTFSSLWKEISTALVALGLDQTEIDRLKEEKCGAKDYLDVEESSLADLCQAQSTTQHNIKELRATQLEDHKTYQDSKSVLGEIHRSQNTAPRSIEERPVPVTSDFEEGSGISAQSVRHSIGKDPNSESSSCSPVAAFGESKRYLVKAGVPLDDALEDLSLELGEIWERLGRRLGFKQATIDEFDSAKKALADKAFKMLMAWKRREGSNATYKVLYLALCDKKVQCKLLAQQFCCDEIVGNASA